MAKKRKKHRVNARFFIFLGGIAAVVLVVILVFLLMGGGGTDTVRMGAMENRLSVAGAIIREESVVKTDKYEKIIFHVVEGQAVAKDTLIADVFKRGYTDESMIAVLNLQKEIYAAQKKLLGSGDATLNSINEAILSVERNIREVARGYDDTDMLELEQRLKALMQERIDYLKRVVTPDQSLTALYNQLDDQQNSLKNMVNSVYSEGSGVVSFYFDGHEQSLNADKLNTVNVSQISNLVSKSNTADKVELNTQSNLYRLVSPNHWFLAYTSAVDDPLRVVAGEQYYVTFDDYSNDIYQATAREPIVYAEAPNDGEETSASKQGVVNLLEFYVDIGNFAGIRTVNATIVKAAQGLTVDADSVVCEVGVPYVYVKSGDQVMKVAVEVLAINEKEAVIRSKNGNAVLAAGQRLVKP
ncbi:MAG: HlyD family efflux transporter periplasmic adaptor subunit [Clostridia bacterium]|nr:HlyD family efflux transporter periplasmic adaptor subunit [Clostridia bacterium]